MEISDQAFRVLSIILGQHPQSSKRALFLKCYPEMPKIRLFFKKDTFLSNLTRGSIQLPDADFFWIIPWFYH